MKVIAIDPGTYALGIVIIESKTFEIIDSFKIKNNLGIICLEFDKYYSKEKGYVVVEKLQPQGKRVGMETFETIYFSGRIEERVELKYPMWKCERLGRKAVLGHLDKLYGAMSNDAKIRQILISRFGKEHTKKLIADCWQAFALGVVFIDKLSEK